MKAGDDIGDRFPKTSIATSSEGQGIGDALKYQHNNAVRFSPHKEQGTMLIHQVSRFHTKESTNHIAPATLRSPSRRPTDHRTEYRSGTLLDSWRPEPGRYREYRNTPSLSRHSKRTYTSGPAGHRQLNVATSSRRKTYQSTSGQYNGKVYMKGSENGTRNNISEPQSRRPRLRANRVRFEMTGPPKDNSYKAQKMIRAAARANEASCAYPVYTLVQRFNQTDRESCPLYDALPIAPLGTAGKCSIIDPLAAMKLGQIS